MDEAKRREVLQQVYRGTKAGVAPASITLFFRQEDSSSSSDTHASLPHSAPPSYQDLLRTPPLATSSGTLQTLSTETMVCNIIASEVGLSAETVVCSFSKVASIVTLHSNCNKALTFENFCQAPVFLHSANEGGEGRGVRVMGILILASNPILQAQGLYQVSEHHTPQGICRRLCELISSSASTKNSLSPSNMGLFWDPRIRKELGVIERVEVAVVKTAPEQERAEATGLVAYRSSSTLEQEVQELRDRAEAAELARNELLTDVEQLRETATELSRQVDDADGTTALTIPREKLEEVLRDAQERIDIAEARCEQLTVQVLLLQSGDRDKSTGFQKGQTAFFQPRISSELGDVSQDDELREHDGSVSQEWPHAGEGEEEWAWQHEHPQVQG